MDLGNLLNLGMQVYQRMGDIDELTEVGEGMNLPSFRIWVGRRLLKIGPLPVQLLEVRPKRSGSPIEPDSEDDDEPDTDAEK